MLFVCIIALFWIAIDKFSFKKIKYVKIVGLKKWKKKKFRKSLKYWPPKKKKKFHEVMGNIVNGTEECMSIWRQVHGMPNPILLEW